MKTPETLELVRRCLICFSSIGELDIPEMAESTLERGAIVSMGSVVAAMVVELKGFGGEVLRRCTEAMVRLDTAEVQLQMVEDR